MQIAITKNSDLLIIYLKIYDFRFSGLRYISLVASNAHCSVYSLVYKIPSFCLAYNFEDRREVYGKIECNIGHNTKQIQENSPKSFSGTIQSW